MLVTNPFVALYERPFETLTLLGYALLLVTLLVLSTGYVYQTVVALIARWRQERPHKWEFVPPMGYWLRLASIPFIFMFDAWAAAGLVYLLT